jgi:hypothetical protein
MEQNLVVDRFIKIEWLCQMGGNPFVMHVELVVGGIDVERQPIFLLVVHVNILGMFGLGLEDISSLGDLVIDGVNGVVDLH